MNSNQWFGLLVSIGEAALNFLKALLGMNTKK